MVTRGALFLIECESTAGLNGFFGIMITPLSQTLYFLVMALGINHIILLVST